MTELYAPVLRRLFDRANRHRLRHRPGSRPGRRVCLRHSPRARSEPERIRLLHHRELNAGDHQPARDIGISIGLVSIGGRVWHDRERFGQLIVTGLQLRRLLGLGAILIVTPVLFYMLAKNGAPIGDAIVLTVIVLAGSAVQLTAGVLGAVPRLRSDIKVIQRIDLTSAIIRFLLPPRLSSSLPAPGVAVTIFTLAFFLQYLLLRRYVSRVINLHAAPNAEDRKSMLGFIRNQAANAIFFCFQGQITIFLISLLGANVSSRGRGGRPRAVGHDLHCPEHAPGERLCAGIRALPSKTKTGLDVCRDRRLRRGL